MIPSPVAIPSTKAADALARLSRRVNETVGVFQGRQSEVERLTMEAAALDARVQLLTLTDAALATLLTTVSAESLQAIEQTITYGLHTVFEDRGLAFRFVVTQSRGVQSAEPMLTANGVEAPVLDAFGGGPATLVAFLLRLITCFRSGLYPLVLMDEVFSMVSVEYVPNLAKLLRELAEKLGYTFLLVTQAHRDELTAEATRAYEIVTGADGASFRELVK